MKQITSSLLLFLLIVSCENFKGGQHFYEAGLKYYQEADGGDVYDYQGMKNAIVNFEKAIEKGYKKREVFDKLTWSYRLLNQDNENMERVYSLALEHYPNDVEFYFRRGDCRKELKKHKQAFDDFNKAIQLDTTRNYEYINDAFYERGAMRFILGDTVNADKDREIAKSMTEFDLRTYQDYCKLWK
jgi:tetratricopeptide (TPR) repeat protein